MWSFIILLLGESFVVFGLMELLYILGSIDCLKCSCDLGMFMFVCTSSTLGCEVFVSGGLCEQCGICVLI